MSKPKTTLFASLGLLILRVSFGIFMLVHGWPKLLRFREMAEAFPDPIGIGSRFSLILTIGAEVGCSALLIAGLATRLAAVPLAITMLVALAVVHQADPWSKKELAALYLTVYVTLVFTGGGRFSCDRFVWKRKKSS